MTDAFGYVPGDTHQLEIASLTFSEGKHAETLQPRVIVHLRFAMDSSQDHVQLEKASEVDPSTHDYPAVTEQVALVVTPSFAEEILSRLQRAIQVAKDRHWED